MYTKYIYAHRSININITFAVKSSIRGERISASEIFFFFFFLVYSSYMYWKSGSFYFSNRPLYDQQTNYFKDHINTRAYKQTNKQTNRHTPPHRHRHTFKQMHVRICVVNDLTNCVYQSQHCSPHNQKSQNRTQQNKTKQKQAHNRCV